MNNEILNLIEIKLSEIESWRQNEYDKVDRGQGKLKMGAKTLRLIMALRVISARLCRIKELLQIKKYDLVFIGKVGVGKTTAICHLFDLLREEKKTRNVEGEKIEEISIKEILATGAGRTTICEVVIRTSPTNSLEIDPYSEHEIIQSIEIFCVYIWKRIYPKSTEAPDVSEPELAKSDALPAELHRAIRNLVKLKKITRQGNQLDEADELAKQFTNYQDFRDEVISRAKLSSRTIKKIEMGVKNKKSVISQKKWIEERFNEINLCSLSDISIPRRIYVNLSPEILDLSEYPFKSIIDTRGIDEGQDREDISYYIRDDDATICIFTEKFSDVPINVIGLIGKYLTPESREIDTKLAIITMPRQGEPRRVVGQNGQVASKEEGITVRTNQIKDSFEGQNIKFLGDNILFYDALQFYDDEDRVLKPRHSQDSVTRDKERVVKEISNLVERRRNNLCREVKYLSRWAETIQAGELSQEDENLIESLKKTIEKLQHTNFSFNFEADYVQKLKNYHVMVFRGLNNRCGIYEYRGINIFFDAKSLTEDIIRKRLGNPKAEIIGAIENTEELVSAISGLKPVLEVLKSQINEDYESLAIQVSQEVYDLLKLNKFAPLDDFNPFWQNTQSRWGKGKGYRDAVLSMYEKQLKAIDEFLKNKAQEFWYQEFMAKILEFLA